MLALLGMAVAAVVTAPASANTPTQFPQAGLDLLAQMDDRLDKAVFVLKPGQPDPNRGDIRVLDHLAKKVARQKHDLLETQFAGQKVLCQSVEAAYSRLEKADLALERATKGTADDAAGQVAVARTSLLTLSAGIALAPDQDPSCNRAANEAAAADLDKIDKQLEKVADKLDNVIKKLGKNASMTQQDALVKDIREAGREKKKVIREHMREETYCVRFDGLYGNLYLIDRLLLDARRELDAKHPDFNDVYGDFKGARSIKEFVEFELKQPCPPTGGGGGENCSSTLERSPGTAPYTAVNHIRVRATCNQVITKVEVNLVTMNSFDACAQTKGTATGCTASGQLLTTNWNQPANSELEFYGRVTGNAAGMYHVTIYGTGGTVLKEYDATVP